MHLGPEEVLFNLEVEFRDGLSTAELREAIDRLEHAIQDRHPEVKHIFIEAESLGAAAR
jgi:divalent metal cation (Fe/Co/Zn/Cd) transporter